MQRRVEAHDSLDDYPTPPWSTRALCEFLLREGEPLSRLRLTCREPTANRGHMVKPLAEYFDSVEASDVHDYGAGFPVRDYLFGEIEPVDWTIFNPPFRLAEQFIERALATSRRGCAAIVRSAFLEGVGRYERLFAAHPPAFVLQFTERVVMHRGRLAPEGSTATAYCWLVWWGKDIQPAETSLRWIAPCRRRLERDGDYPAYPTAETADAPLFEERG